jgi:hypothetical protein
MSQPQRADVRHAQHLGDIADRGFRQPAVVLLLGTPQQRNDRRLLAAVGIARDHLLGPSQIVRREGEFLGLLFGRCEAAIGH